MELAKKLHESSQPHPARRGKWVPDATFDDVRTVIGSAFAGTEDIRGDPFADWAAAHMDRSWYTPSVRREMLRFGVGFGVYSILQSPKDALVIAKGSDETDGLIAVAVVVAKDGRRPAQKSSLMSMLSRALAQWYSFCALLTMVKSDGGVPKPYRDRSHKADAERFVRTIESLEADVEEYHAKYGPEGRHWHVKMVGVDPSYSGQGYGRELMERVSMLADAEGVSCYLETGHHNVGFYAKMGYRTLKKVPIRDSTDKNREPCDGYLMVRKPHKQK